MLDKELKPTLSELEFLGNLKDYDIDKAQFELDIKQALKKLTPIDFTNILSRFLPEDYKKHLKLRL